MILRSPKEKCIALAVLFLSLACQSPRAADNPATIRDSAGIRIVETRATNSPRHAWTIDTVPQLEIGGSGSAPHEALHQVNFVRTLPSGGIGVVNNATAQIFFYDSTGAHTRSLGRKGDGPGEFRFITRFTFAGDSLVVVDEQYPSRYAVFDESLKFVREHPLSASADLAEAEVLGFAGADLIVLRGTPERCEATAPNGFWWMCAQLHGTSHRTGTTASLPVNTLSHITRGTPLAFPVRSRAAASDSGIFLAVVYPFEIRRYSATGGLQLIARLDREPVAVNQSHIDQFEAARKEMLSRVSAQQAAEMLRRMGGAPQYPPFLPTYDGVLPTMDGGVWARLFSYPADSATRWDVFDVSGVYAGIVQLPPHFRPFEVGPDYVLGIRRDSLDVERAQLLRIRKPKF